MTDAETIEALEEKCALLAASLKRTDHENLVYRIALERLAHLGEEAKELAAKALAAKEQAAELGPKARELDDILRETVRELKERK